MGKHCLAALCATAAIAAFPVHAAPAGGTADTFEDGTVQGWQRGSERPGATAAGTVATPRNVAGGGPAGSGDHYLQLTADGAGPQSHLTAYNRAQWSGSFAGITRIEVDLRNVQNPAETQELLAAAGGRPIGTEIIAPATMQVRLAFSARDRNTYCNVAANCPSGSVPQAWVTEAFAVPADDLWHHAVFSLDAARMTRYAGAVSTNAAILAADPTQGVLDAPLSLDAMLAGAYQMHLIQNPGVDFRGQGNFFGTLGADNIVAVPEPAAAAMLFAGLLALAARRRALAARG